MNIPDDIAFHHKPLVVAGRAMQHYGLRAGGDDVDMVVHPDDFELLRATHPVERGDYGDERIRIAEFEIYDGFFSVPYDLLKHGAVEMEDCLIASLPVLLYLASFYSSGDSQLIIDALHAQNRL
jgi:hypothetical protein